MKKHIINKKKSKKIKKNQKKCKFRYFYVIICAVLLFVIFSFLLYKVVNPFYKVESRVLQVKQANKKRSEKVLGWIKVQGTNIDYPILYSHDEDTDVKNVVDYDFAWSNSDTQKLTNRPILFGHNILNMSSQPLITSKNHKRFEQLLSFIYSSFVRNNKYIQYTIGNKDYVYKIFSVSVVEKDINKYSIDSFDKEEMKKYIKQSKKDSYFDFDVDVDSNDGIITLITCTRLFGGNNGYDFKIDGRLIRKGEMISNYNVREKNNYIEIKKILKGDETNEKA